LIQQGAYRAWGAGTAESIQSLRSWYCREHTKSGELGGNTQSLVTCKTESIQTLGSRYNRENTEPGEME
jgi:hypothetical protein